MGIRSGVCALVESALTGTPARRRWRVAFMSRRSRRRSAVSDAGDAMSLQVSERPGPRRLKRRKPMKGPPLPTNSPSPTPLLPDHVTLGEPDRSGPLTVFPVLGEPGSLEYLSFAEASAHGCVVRELEPASVNDVLVVNPLDVPVLLYEGEEVQGAQQDRTVDLAVLVPAGARQRVAVSCVEAGRWDGARRGEAFA